MKASPARVLAAGVVERVVRDDAWTPGVLNAALKAARLDRREAAFATRLAYGAVELMPALDAALKDRAQRPGRIKPRVMAALRVSAYEILMLDTPPAVAVDQGVALVKSRDSYAAGFANAVLRRLADDAPGFPWGDPATDMDALARLTGFGRSLTDRLLSDVGEQTARALMLGSVGAPPLYLAVNPILTTTGRLVEDLEAAGTATEEYEPVGCLRCTEPAAALASGVLDDGRGIVADRSAQVVASLVPLQPGARVLDIAAGRGNKTALIAFAAAREGHAICVDAVDLHEWKCEVLRARMKLLEVTSVTAYALDATDAGVMRANVGTGFDSVLVDVPCSNLGTLRRHPERRWRFDTGSPEELASLGLTLLGVASRLVRPGGFVVYSTCTVLPAENHGVIDAFLADGQGVDFRVADIAGRVPADMSRYVTQRGYFQSMPEPDGPDGHFAALLQREK